MIQDKASAKIYKWIKSAVAAAMLPVVFIYIMIAKPDYQIMNGLAHVVLPVAQFVGDIVTWPIRIMGDTIVNIHELSNLRTENEILRAQLDEALTNKNICDVAIKENKKLQNELDLVNAQPQEALIADVMYDNTTLHHNTFMINRGTSDNIERGMAVVSTDGFLAGIVIDMGTNFARVRALNDTDSNIAVRIVGTDVYGFLQGNGSATAKIGLFSKPDFRVTPGAKLITSNISGVLPGGIFVGNITNQNEITVINPRNISRVMVLKYNGKNNYK
ncbi:MAG: rod shape-determining protein MreC [Proteobacteria bacterium]|nr:rod shape-determining protein MreC [Candidatus Enterousia scatequi]